MKTDKHVRNSISDYKSHAALKAPHLIDFTVSDQNSECINDIEYKNSESMGFPVHLQITNNNFHR